MKHYPLCGKGHLPEVVILADGNFPRTRSAVEMLKRLPIVCCDGATGKLLRHGYKPHAIVGDGDSLSSVLRKQYASIIHLEKEQETNDLSKAFRFCLETGWSRKKGRSYFGKYQSFDGLYVLCSGTDVDGLRFVYPCLRRF